jgi:hypothetical protein
VRKLRLAHYPYRELPGLSDLWLVRRVRRMNRIFVLHRCDTPACVNPDHLFLGTAKDNALDREAKGRGRWSRSASGARA